MASLLLDRCVVYPASGKGVPVKEALLHAALQDSHHLFIGEPEEGETVLVIPEQAIANGIPDLVICRLNLTTWERRREEGVMPVTGDSQLLVAKTLQAMSPVDVVPVRDLYQRMSVLYHRREPEVQRALLGLKAKGAITRPSRGTVLLAPSWEPCVSEISAIEAKMANWRRAYEQTRLWQNATHSSWMAFPEAYAPKALAGFTELQQAQTPNVRSRVYESGEPGIAAIAEDSALQIILPPICGTAADDGFFFARAEEFLYHRWLREVST